MQIFAISSFRWLYKRAKCHLNGVNITIFVEKLQMLLSGGLWFRPPTPVYEMQTSFRFRFQARSLAKSWLAHVSRVFVSLEYTLLLPSLLFISVQRRYGKSVKHGIVVRFKFGIVRLMHLVD